MLQEIKSSHIQSVDYNLDNKSLLVMFKTGHVYIYNGVEPKEYNKLVSSKSVGKYFHKHIRMKYPYKKITK